MTDEELQQIFDRDRELRNQVEQPAAMPAERVPTPAEGLRGMASDLEPISEPTEELQTIRETEAADKERGFVTEFGESAQEILDLQSDIPNAFAAGLNAITPDALGPIKQATQGLDDLVLSADERDAKFEELIEEGRENNDPMRYVTEAVYGAEKGVEGGLLLSPLQVPSLIKRLTLGLILQKS